MFLAATSVFSKLLSYSPSPLPIALLRVRSMTTTTVTPTTRHRFFVYAPDKTEEGILERRISVRAIHRENLQKMVDDGFTRIGGVLLTPDSVESTTADKKMIGSVLICEAETLAEVKKRVEADIYYTAGVWDPERIAILPFIAATAVP